MKEHLLQLFSSVNNIISNGLDVYETIICITFIAAIVLLIWIIAWMLIKILIPLIETIKVLINSLENVFNSLFNGIKSALKKIGEFGKQED